MGPLGWIATALIGAIVGAGILAVGIGIGRELGRNEATLFNSEENDG